MEYTLQSLADQRSAIINSLLVEKTTTDVRLDVLFKCLESTDSMIVELLGCIVPYQADVEQDDNVELEEYNEHDS